MPAYLVNHLRIPGGVPKPEGLDEFERLEGTFEPVRPEVARDTTRPRRFERLATKRRLAARRWRRVQRYADAKSGVIEQTCHERARDAATGGICRIRDVPPLRRISSTHRRTRARHRHYRNGRRSL